MAWGEIPVTDMDKAVAFYNEVFGYEMQIDTSGPNPIAFWVVLKTAQARIFILASLPLMAAAQSISQSPIR